MAPAVRHQVSLKRLNSFGVEARAARLIELEAAADLPAAIALARDVPPALVLGGGSNLLFAHDPPGTVLRMMLRGRRLVGHAGDATVVEAAAGETWHDFVGWTIAQGLNGLENLALIPGSVGASPVQNVGAYGVEVGDCLESLDAVSLLDGGARRFDAADCGFGYRDSIFKRAAGAHWLITAVRFRLSRSPRPRLDYGELREELRARGISVPGARDVAEAVCAIRRRKLPDPAAIGNAGSFFKNPVVPAAHAGRLRSAHPDLPIHPGPDGDSAKLPAAWLIERCGWKGHRDGDAGVHARHALVLVNHGAATGAQILALSERIRESVQARFGIALEREPVVV